jgi:hypothetical protein
MRKGWKKKNKKGFLLCWAGGRVFGPPRRERARARLRPGCGPRVRETAQVRGDDGVAVGPLVSESGGGETALRPDGVGELAERGRKAGRRWARRRFAAGGLVLGPREGGLARAEAGDSKGRLNSARGGWEGAVHGEVAELRGRDRRRWALGEGLGLGSGASGSWPREGAARFT